MSALDFPSPHSLAAVQMEIDVHHLPTPRLRMHRVHGALSQHWISSIDIRVVQTHQTLHIEILIWSLAFIFPPCLALYASSGQRRIFGVRHQLYSNGVSPKDVQAFECARQPAKLIGRRVLCPIFGITLAGISAKPSQASFAIQIEPFNGEAVAVLGGGAFGTAFAQLMARLGYSVKWYVRNSEVRKAINERRVNPQRMSDVAILPNITAVGDIRQAVAGSSLILVAIPTANLRGVFVDHSSYFPKSVPIIVLSKGIENGSLQTPVEIVREELPPEYSPYVCAISGPSFAADILKGKPTLVTLATENEQLGVYLQRRLHDSSFAVFISTDVRGVEYGGALKNVIAIASGMSDGLRLGSNARAAIITRGLAEIAQIIVAKGGSPLTPLGLTGVGDLLLTSMSTTSRNYMVGFRLGCGERMEDIRASMSEVAEGVTTAKSVHALIEDLHLDAPICQAVYMAVWNNADPGRALQVLWDDPQGAENSAVCSLLARSGRGSYYC
eukprot:EG_transcript_9004